MTVNEQSSRKVILGAGWVNPLTHAYVIENAAHVHVFADDVELTQGVDYTVTNVLNPAGYAVTITNPGSWTPTNWVLDARPPIDQQKDLTVGGSFGGKFEDGLDKLTRRVERVWDLARRGLKTGLSVAVGDNPYTLPAPSADGLIGWNPDGTDLETKTPAALGVALVDNDTTLSTDSPTRVPSQHAVKTYVDTFKALFTTFGLSLMAATTYAEAWMVLKLNGSLSTRALIKALVPQAGMSVLLTESGRVGNFVWRTGDYSAQIAADTLEGMYLKANSVASNVGAWVREHEGLIKPNWFNGTAGDNVGDDRAAIVAALTVANDVFLSFGKTYRITDTVNMTAAQQTMRGFGTLRCDFGNGSAARPAIFADTTATEAVVQDFTIDHNGATYVVPTARSGNLIWGSAVILSSDDSKAVNLTVKNAWDNGVAICQFVGATGTFVANNPRRAKALHIQGFGCGCGNHGVAIGKQGACVDLATGTQCEVSDCIDKNSAMGFILDVGGGAQGTFSNCISFNAVKDAVQPAGGSGLGFYVGGADSSFVNCQAFYAGLDGWWVDAPALNNTYSGCHAFASQRRGFRIDSGNSAFIGCTARENSQEAANTYDGFALTHTTAKTGLEFHGCRSLGAQQRYGFNAVPTGGGSIQGGIFGGAFEGTTGRVNLNGQAITLLYSGTEVDGKIAIGHLDPRVKLDIAGPDFAGTAIGALTNLGQLFAGPLSQPLKRVAIGYGSADDSGIIQAIHAGVSTKKLKLNPTNSPVTVGPGGLWPEVDDGAALGDPVTNRWADAYFAAGAVLNFNNGNYTITHSAGVLTFSGQLLTANILGHPAGQGAGGTVAQATSRTTAVTINKATGQITTNNASLAAGASAKFTVNNSAVAAVDNVIVSIASGSTTDLTDVKVQAVAAGGFNIVVVNRHSATAETGAIVINFEVIKGASN